MAELTAFAYQAGTSVLHRVDVRMKLALVAAASLVGLRLDFTALGLMGAALLILASGGRHGLRIRPGECRWIALLLALVFAARALSVEGTPVFSLVGWEISREGLQEGARVCLRLALAFLLGAVLVGTTRSTEIRAGVQWFLKPLPFAAAARVGTMLGLLVRFIPVVFEEVSRISDAQRARAVENRRNPIRRAVKLGVPVMSRIFERSNRLALAMEARCYSESRTPPELKAGARDWAVLALGCGWLAVLLAV